VQTNKSDYLDAEAIAEAVQRPRRRFVPIKREGQLDMQAWHRVRERWVMQRTAGYPSWPESLTPLKAEYISADQLPSSSFRLQLGGGPYIPTQP
jgi:transposase